MRIFLFSYRFIQGDKSMIMENYYPVKFVPLSQLCENSLWGLQIDFTEDQKSLFILRTLAANPELKGPSSDLFFSFLFFFFFFKLIRAIGRKRDTLMCFVDAPFTFGY